MDTPREVFVLCDKLLDGSLTVEDRERLEALVLGSKEARLAYLEYMQIHAGLKDARLKDVALSEVVNMVPGAAPRIPRASSGWGRVALAAAAAVGILAAGWGLGAWKADNAQKAATVATLIETKGARWDSGTLSTEPGAALSKGHLRLSAGLATLEFRKGARLTLEGPADLELVSGDRCHLHHGALTAHVPPQATGFIVETSNARLVDHGTDFGISTASGGEAQVQVFQGEVELQHATSGGKLRLLTRESASITAADVSRSKRLEDETVRASLGGGTAGPNVLSITTADGAGRAAYAWSPETDTHFSDTLLLLKNCRELACRRKAWLGFDLTPLQGREIAEASLTLTFEPTGWGYASLQPDSTFAVYGVTEDGLDAWQAEKLDWANAPANQQDSGGGVDTGRAVKLGTFTMPQGVLEGAFTVKSAALARFMQEDANRYATLVVVRETSELKHGAVVHGFAGNNHPTLKPPTLRVVVR